MSVSEEYSQRSGLSYQVGSGDHLLAAGVTSCLSPSSFLMVLQRVPQLCDRRPTTRTGDPSTDGQMPSPWLFYEIFFCIQTQICVTSSPRPTKVHVTHWHNETILTLKLLRCVTQVP